MAQIVANPFLDLAVGIQIDRDWESRVFTPERLSLASDSEKVPVPTLLRVLATLVVLCKSLLGMAYRDTYGPTADGRTPWLLHR